MQPIVNVLSGLSKVFHYTKNEEMLNENFFFCAAFIIND